MKNSKKFTPAKVVGNVITYEEAVASGLSSSFVRTIARSLERLSKDCFRRLREENFDSLYQKGEKETKASLTQTGKLNSENSFAMRTLATRLKKDGL